MRSTGPTEKQRKAYELRAQGQTWEEIAQAMGCKSPTAQQHVAAGVKRGLPPLLKDTLLTRIPAPNGGEPTRVARIKEGEGMFEGQKFDPKVFLEMAASAGIPPRIAQALGRRVEMQFGPIKSEIRKLTHAEQVTATTAAAQLVLAHIDEVSIAGMNAKDLAIAYGVLVDKALILGGKPTQIIDFNVRARIEVLMPQMLAEARRRGITVDGTATVVQDAELLAAQK